MTTARRKKIQITTSSFAELDRGPFERLESSGYEIVDNPYKRKVTKEELNELLDSNVIGLLAGLEILDREVLEKSNLQIISRVGSGLSNVDLKAAEELGIKVYSTPDGPTTAVAELTVGALLNLIRMCHQMDQDLHHGQWNKRIGLQLEGKNVAIIGFGRIGKKVASFLKPFGAKILIVDPLYDNDDQDCRGMSMSEALAKADIITIHSSGEACLLRKQEFSLLKKGVFILNASRGGVLSETDLINALDSGIVAGAWIDTFEKEPYTGPLTSYKQVILTPHVGSYTLECRKKMEIDAVENLLRGLER